MAGRVALGQVDVFLNSVPFKSGKRGFMWRVVMSGLPKNICPHLICEKAGRHRSLKELPRGCRAKVLTLAGNPEQRGRLCSLGLTPGTEVEVCDDFPGACRLLVRGTALALDGELARGVICETE